MKRKTSCCHSEDSNKRQIDYLFYVSLIGVGTLYIISLFFLDWFFAHSFIRTMANTVNHMIGAVWWGVLIGVVFIGVLSKIPREFIMSILGKGGTISGILRAIGAGVLLDLCSHGILMVATKLYERGASSGQVIAFLLASPWNSFTLTFILIGLIGFKWVMIFILCSTLIAFITGWFFDLMVKHKVLPANCNTVILPDNFNFLAEAKRSFKSTHFDIAYFKEIILCGLRDSKIVVRWLLFGILLAAILRVVLDANQFEHFFGPTFLGLMVTIIMATVLEVCSEGSTPVAADILTHAKAPGNGFAFLMAGVATDYTEIMSIKDVSKSWKLALFIPLISVPQTLLIAWFMNVYG